MKLESLLVLYYLPIILPIILYTSYSPMGNVIALPYGIKLKLYDNTIGLK